MGVPGGETLDVLDTAGPDDDRGPSRRPRGRLLLAAVLGAVLGAAGWNAFARVADSKVDIAVETALPFTVERYGAAGLLRVSNEGSEPVTLLGVDLPEGDTILTAARLPRRLEPGAHALVVVSADVRCGTEPTPTTLLLQIRRSGGGAELERASVDSLRAAVAQLRRQCEPSLPFPRTVSAAFAGLVDTDDGLITIRVVVTNSGQTRLLLRDLAAASGWPLVDAAASTPLPVGLPPGTPVQLDLAWDVSGCGTDADPFLDTHLRLDLQPGGWQLAELAGGITYEREVLDAYADLCG